jgi:predicted lipid-binding transport protein (Tim44 family)
MKKLSSFLFTLLIAFTLSIGAIPDAEAKRFGGMKSFGSKSSYNKSYSNKSAKLTPRTASQQKAYSQNQTARKTMSKRGGLMGMLGGLALGGMLGALFFGGAFEDLNFMDLLIFGGIAFLLLKLFAAKANKQQPQAAYNRNSHGSHHSSNPLDIENNYLRNNHQDDANFDETTSSQPDDSDNATVVPKGFDEKAFLEGAENAYKVLQSAWDNKELAEIRGLTTDKVFAEIQSQMQEMDGENQTDILTLNAQLLEIREVGKELEATVLFDALLREERDSRPQQVREVWTFIKQKNSPQPKWYLDGLQQLET